MCYGSIKYVYDKNSPYYCLSSDIHDVHMELEKYYDNFYNNVNQLYSKTSEWPNLFTQIKSQINKREEARKTYDHYDEKMEKIYKNRQEKSRKGSTESNKEIDFLNRNEGKFKKATEDYVKASETTFEQIQTILDKRFDLINPVLAEFVEEEKIFFSSAANIFKKLEGVGSKFISISRKAERKPVSYDPCKYIRGGQIIQKEKVREKSPEEITKRSKLNERPNEEENFRPRSRSNVPIRQEDELKYNKNNQNNTNNFNNRDNIINTSNNNNQRSNQYYYQEQFSGINDRFSNDPNNNYQRQSQTIYNKQNNNVKSNGGFNDNNQISVGDYVNNNGNYERNNNFNNFNNNNYNQNYNNNNFDDYNNFNQNSYRGNMNMNTNMNYNNNQTNNNNYSNLNVNKSINNNMNNNNSNFNFDNIFPNNSYNNPNINGNFNNFNQGNNINNNNNPNFGNTRINNQNANNNFDFSNMNNNFNRNSMPQSNPKNCGKDDVFRDLF